MRMILSSVHMSTSWCSTASVAITPSEKLKLLLLKSPVLIALGAVMAQRLYSLSHGNSVCCRENLQRSHDMMKFDRSRLWTSTHTMSYAPTSSRTLDPQCQRPRWVCWKAAESDKFTRPC